MHQKPKALTKSLFRLILILGALSLIACDRMPLKETEIRVQIPQEFEDQIGLQSGQKACFGVSVSGSNIQTHNPSSCSPSLGPHSGFVPPGGELILSQIPSGQGRNFTLYMIPVRSDLSCPTWNQAFNSQPGQPFSSVYKVGESLGVNLSQPDQTVDIPFNLSGLSAPLSETQNLTSCAPTSGPQLRSLVTSDGEVRTPIYTELIAEHPLKGMITAAFSFLENQFGGGFQTTSQLVFQQTYGLEKPAFEVSPIVSSITWKPDSSLSSPTLFGLIGEGTVVALDSNGQIINTNTCPFISCQVPPWIQSISAGYNSDLYALDHAGNIYKVTGVEQLTFTGIQVDQRVTHISFY